MTYQDIFKKKSHEIVMEVVSIVLNGKAETLTKEQTYFLTCLGGVVDFIESKQN
jgi:hypothetical protein